EEEGELVLIDYKTDRLDEEKLRLFYKPQLEIYREALEQLTNQKVKEMALYSFHLGKEIAFS
ncbi:MAG: PD-(D/E)XK nuclease family protein, partial [Lachnospiraceae bacterium]|nr:PD-(D/E)XK nuclease family protein [Lachnospiraceae bacterium]